MSLDSLDTRHGEDEEQSFSDRKTGLSERGVLTESNWVFLFTHRRSIDEVDRKLRERFETFVHRSIVYQRRAKGKVTKKELPTISGLIFIHGDVKEVKSYLGEYFPALNLTKDYASGRVAEISDREMSYFMKLSAIGEEEVRFMLNPLDYYADGHQRIRITSGKLKGCEGYIVRLHRDRKLVTQIGNMTVAIGGISKESFENAEEFVESRVKMTDCPETDLTPAEREKARHFFTPANDLEAMAIVKTLEPLVAGFEKEMASGRMEEAAEGVMFTLSEIGSRFAPRYFRSGAVGVGDLCLSLVELLKRAIDSPEAGQDTKERITIGLESIMLRYPQLPVDEIINTAD